MIRVGADRVGFPGAVGVNEGHGDEVAFWDSGGGSQREGVAEDGFYWAPDLGVVVSNCVACLRGRVCA